MSRRNVARLIMICWIAALGWLAYRQLFIGESARMTARASRLPPDARYYRVDVGSLQVGTVNMTWDTLPTGFRIQEMLSLDLPAGDGMTRHLALSEATTSRALTLQRLTRTYSALGGGEEQRADVAHDSLVRIGITLRDQGGGANAPLRPDGRPTWLTLVPMRFAFSDGLSVGGTMEVGVLDMERNTVRELGARITGDSIFIVADSVEADSVTGEWRTLRLDTIPTWRVELDGERWWVDQLGRLVRRETPFGVTIMMAPFDYASLAYRDTLRITGPEPRRPLAGIRTLAASGVTLDTDAAELRFHVSRVDGPAPPGAVAALGKGNQSAQGDTLTITREWREGSTPPPPALQEREALRRIQPPRMQPILDSALTGARTLRDSVTGLSAWVTTRIARDSGAVRYRDPLILLSERSANPDGMARMVVALAEGAGLTARVVTGVAVTAGGLLGHAWVEFWTGADWVPVDPWSGQVPASARLVRIAEGGLGRPFESFLRTGALRLEPITPGAR
ncbi:MAG TPA: transglutaminase family protein [Gemmatimonadales bacterium]|nr:transglutaminase family protein [Gemmatimonadales bacterium]